MRKSQTQMKEMCYVLAVGLAVVAVAVFYVVAISEFYVGRMSQSNSITLEAISIQVAQNL
ncbi:hypothetical protein [Flavobacterium sp. ZB4R12]|uniref:hypothetical protein n=1 Tax=Flavobacterium sp. ZB4R12 TaxID=3398732 RepID=UPI003AAEDB33